MYRWVVHCFRNYAVFKGRAGRPEYWWFYLFTLLGNFLINLITMPLGSSVQSIGEFLWLAALLVPSLSVASRRLHDGGHTFWWAFVPLLAIVPIWLFVPNQRPLTTSGALVIVLMFALFGVLIVFLARPGDKGPNRYGETAPTEPT
jgi:uncharacterized membrane protein YhaH (DUF805 family)